MISEEWKEFVGHLENGIVFGIYDDDKETREAISSLIWTYKGCSETDSSSDSYVFPNMKTYVDFDDANNFDTRWNSWSEIFPDREEADFGKDNVIFSQPVWEVLTKIYEEWVRKLELAEKLEKEVEEIEDLQTEELRKIISEKADPNGELVCRIRKWLKDYQKLDEAEQSRLQKKKEELELFLKGSDITKKSWYQKIEWKPIMISAGIVTVIIIVLLVIYNYLKKLFG
jgi:hypothetical protein